MNRFGTGLGLGICQALAQRLNHELYYTSEYNKGSLFGVIIKNSWKIDPDNISMNDSIITNKLDKFEIDSIGINSLID